jgi:hypothetical protein
MKKTNQQAVIRSQMTGSNNRNPGLGVSLSQRHLHYCKALAVLALGCALARPATAGVITWDLSAIGLSGAASFTADALQATETTHIGITGPTTFSEQGFADVTGISENNVISTPTGLNTTYSLYFEFDVTGSLATQQFTSFSMDLYAVEGVAVFGYDGNDNAYVNNGANSAILLATNTLVSGSIAGTPFVTPLSADSLSTFTPTVAGTPVFLSPQLPALFHGSFFHPISDIAPAVDGGFTLTGGDDTLTFAAPEPSSLLLLLGAMPGILLVRRKR